jgi:polar amino acid transport system substrate-binding protein
MRWLVNLLLVVVVPTFLVSLPSCDDLPLDQAGTFDRVRRTRELRVGLIEDPPYVVRTSGEPEGVEVEMLRRFAAKMNVRPMWTWGGDERLMTALEHFDMDVVAGGFTDSTPWRQRIGLTSPYAGKHVLAVPPGENHLLKQLEQFMTESMPEIESMLGEPEAK